MFSELTGFIRSIFAIILLNALQNIFVGLTSTSIQALSKLTSNSDVADDIIGVIQSALSQFTSKTIDSDSIDVALNVRYVKSFTRTKSFNNC